MSEFLAQPGVRVFGCERVKETALYTHGSFVFLRLAMAFRCDRCESNGSNIEYFVLRVSWTLVPTVMCLTIWRQRRMFQKGLQEKLLWSQLSVKSVDCHLHDEEGR